MTAKKSALLLLGVIIAVGAMYAILLPAPGMAGSTDQLDRAVAAVTNALPSGWTLAERKTNEVPYGHHWNDDYTGPKGLLLIVKGTRPVDAEFSDATYKWRAVHVATESLEIWLMPSNYKASRGTWFALIAGPVPPKVVVNRGPIKVYATESSVLLSQRDFDEILNKSTGVMWPDSPRNKPELLSWKDWRQKLRKALEEEFAK
jgi:hypothetical protein